MTQDKGDAVFKQGEALLKEKEKGEEENWRRNEDRAFRVRLRTHKLMAHAVAGRLGLSGAAHDGYVNDAVAALMDGVDVLEHFQADLRARGLPDHLEPDLSRVQARAEREILAEDNSGGGAPQAA